MAKPAPQIDVLVLGEHPSAYLAAAMLAQRQVRVAHTTIPGEPSVERLVLVNPAMFALDPLLAPLRRKLDSTTHYGIRFIGNDTEPAEHRSKSGLAGVAEYSAVREAARDIARACEIDLHRPGALNIGQLDEKGVEVSIDSKVFKPRMLIVAGTLPDAQRRLLGVDDAWSPDVLRRVSLLRMRGPKWTEPAPKPLVQMSLDLCGNSCWGWMMSHGGVHQLVVEQPVERAAQNAPEELMRKWIEVLKRDGVLKYSEIRKDSVAQFDLPLAGALEQEGVANRALLIGPAGAFYRGASEEIYPACWSAVFAVGVAIQALKATHLQDALQPYRQDWRTTLGEYLRGPRAHLKFLLPLVFRNAVMTRRMTEAVLLGKGVVR